MLLLTVQRQFCLLGNPDIASLSWPIEEPKPSGCRPEANSVKGKNLSVSTICHGYRMLGGNWSPELIIVIRCLNKLTAAKFEICFCVQLVQELKSADVCIVGSDAYSDYRQELLPLIKCKETLTEYGEQVGLPTVSDDFIGHVKQLLAQAAQHTDASYPSNDHFQITDGEPRLRKLPRKPSPQDSGILDKALSQHLDRLDLTLIDVLTETMKWLNWGRFFGPLSGHQRKITEEAKRYILTVFAYGTGLGPAQAARAIPDITARQIAFLNQRHITAEKLDIAIREVINAYNRFALPKCWCAKRSLALLAGCKSRSGGGSV